MNCDLSTDLAGVTQLVGSSNWIGRGTLNRFIVHGSQFMAKPLGGWKRNQQP